MTFKFLSETLQVDSGNFPGRNRFSEENFKILFTMLHLNCILVFQREIMSKQLNRMFRAHGRD